MTRNLERPKVLFFGQAGHAHSEEAAAFLSSLNFEVEIVHSAQRGNALPNWVSQWAGDYIFSFRNYYVLPPQILRRARCGAINFHPGPPEYPGSGSCNWALYDEQTEFGVTAHLMSADIDAGPILEVARFPICDCDLSSLILIAQEYSLALFKKITEDIDKNGITAVSKRASKNVSLKWSGAARRASELDALQFVRADITESELNRRVRAFHLAEYPLFTEIYGKRFFYKG
jgi:methionyl-tRNA formyltransferase